MKPLLAHIYEPHRVTYPCYVQPKLDGIRALYQNGRFQSRDEMPFPEGLLDHLAQPLLGIFGSNHAPKDGELYVHGWPLQRINAAVTPVRLKPTEDTLRVEYHVFDVVDFTLPFWARHNVNNRSDLRNWHENAGDPTKECLFKSNKIPQVNFIESNLVYNEQEADQLYARFVSNGYEGMMYRLGDCPYTIPKQRHDALPLTHRWTCPVSKSGFLSNKDNRCWHLLKRKDWQDDEFLFHSIQPTVGKLNEPGFILTCHSKSSTIPTFNLGSGLSRSEVDFYISEPPVGRQVKVKYLCLSKEGIPRNATILAIL